MEKTIDEQIADLNIANKIKIGLSLKRARLKKDFTQEKLAEIANIGLTYYSRIERGKQNITIGCLINIAIALEMEVGDIIPSIKNLKIE